MKEKLLLSEIHMRDPFVFVDQKQHQYCLFGTTADGSKGRFEMYISDDLVNFKGPYVVFDLKDNDNFWGKEDLWAPEVYYIESLKSYLMFATFHSQDHKRNTVALITDDLYKHAFTLYSDKITPSMMTNLDGTLFYEKQQPRIIFCHEWLEINDGSYVYGKLSKDLKQIEEDSLKVLFRASEIPWSVSPSFSKNGNDYISDGPYVIKKGACQFLLYSTFGENGYQTGYCYTKNKWKSIHHSQEPLIEKNAGHSMVFTGFDHNDYIIYHANNDSPDVVPTIKRITIKKGGLFSKPRLIVAA